MIFLLAGVKKGIAVNTTMWYLCFDAKYIKEGDKNGKEKSCDVYHSYL